MFFITLIYYLSFIFFLIAVTYNSNNDCQFKDAFLIKKYINGNLVQTKQLQTHKKYRVWIFSVYKQY